MKKIVDFVILSGINSFQIALFLLLLFFLNNYSQEKLIYLYILFNCNLQTMLGMKQIVFFWIMLLIVLALLRNSYLEFNKRS